LYAPPPPQSPGSASGYWPTYGYGGPAPEVRKTNPLAVASLVCSAAGSLFLGVPAIPGVILGFVSRSQIRRSGGRQTGAGLGLSGIIVGLVVIAFWAVLITPITRTIEHGALRLPELPPHGFVSHPLTHSVAALPTWMSTRGVRSDRDMSYALQDRVIKELWTVRQDALATLDPNQIAVVDQPGSEAFATDKAFIELAAEGGQNAGPSSRQPDTQDIAISSSTTTYPLALLAEVADATGDASQEVTLMVITKRSATTPWRVEFTTNYITKGTFPQYLVPTPGATSIPFAPATVPAKLAAYWQSWLDDHHAPAGSPFNAGYWTTTLGAQIASNTQGATINDGLNTARIEYRAKYGPWVFGPPGDLPIVCTGIGATVYDDAVGASSMYQDHYRQNWGGLLAPGEYRHIVTTGVHPSCILETADSHLSVLGGDIADISTTGRPS
jgi:hypothetical protein